MAAVRSRYVAILATTKLARPAVSEHSAARWGDLLGAA
jgi:hypothetical protein